MSGDQTEAILRGIKKRRGEEARKAGQVGASVAAAAAACGVKLKRRLRKNTREKQRRLELNDKFDALNDLLPTSGKSKTEKYHILSEAIKLIGDLQQENEDLRQEKLSLANELNKLSIIIREVSSDSEQTTSAPTVKDAPVPPVTSVTSTPPGPASTQTAPPMEYMDYKVPVPPTAGATPQSTFNLQASLDALAGFDMPLPFPPLPPTPSSTPPPDLFSSITGSYGPAGGMSLANSIVGPFSNTLFHPSPQTNVTNVNSDDIDS